MKEGSIGIFDSGLGGLTVYQHAKKLLPKENIIYVADTARAPFGGRPKTELMTFAQQIISFLSTQKVKAILIGCNTISANCYEDLVNMYDIPMFELIESAIAESIAASMANKGKAIGLLATVSSVNSGTFKKGVASRSNLPVYAQGCPLFVPLVEEGLTDPYYSLPAVELYLLQMIEHIDSLVLGCTHYPFLEEAIKSVTKDYGITIVNPAYSTSVKLVDFLKNNHLLNDQDVTVATDKFYTTGDTKKFENLVKKLIGENVKAHSLKL